MNFTEKLNELFEAFGIENIEETAATIGIQSSPKKERDVTEHQMEFTINVIKDHFQQLEEDPDDYEFHLASIWKLANDCSLLK